MKVEYLKFIGFEKTKALFSDKVHNTITYEKKCNILLFNRCNILYYNYCYLIFLNKNFQIEFIYCTNNKEYFGNIQFVKKWSICAVKLINNLRHI